jgi:hypothetical protein
VGKKNYIEVTGVQFITDRILRYSYDFSDDLRKYFRSRNFYVEYDEPINHVEEAILFIPCVGSLAALSWITGSGLFVHRLDRTFLESLNRVRRVLKKFYPHINFGGEVQVNELVSNEFKNEKLGLLFSGGLDSTTLYIRLKHLQPELFTIFGGTIPVQNKPMIRKLKRNVEKFLKKDGTVINYIKTNIREALNESLLTGSYGRFFNSRERTWWEAVNHGIVQLALCAPLTVKNIKHLSLDSAEHEHPHGSHKLLTDQIGWGDVKITTEGYEYSKHEKVKFILKDYIEKTKFYPKLQVCIYSPVFTDQLNCGRCGKCSRNILSLIIEEIDPEKCGFPLSRTYFENFRKNIDSWSNREWSWEDLQEYVNTKERDPSVSQFLEWFKNLDFSSIKNESNLKWSVRSLILSIVSRLPREIRKTVVENFYEYKYLNPRKFN